LSDVAEYVRTCLTCRTVAGRTATDAPVQQHQSPTRPFQFMAVDLLSMPESSGGNKYAMVLIDYFSRYVIVVPLKEKSAAVVVKAIMDKVILVYGRPEKLLSDNGGEFDNELMRQVCEGVGIKKVYTTPYRPQSDGMVERFNRTLLRLLTCYVDSTQMHWDDTLPYVLFAYNTSISSATGEKPFTDIYGKDPPADVYTDIVTESGEIVGATNPAEWREEVKRFLTDEFYEQMRNEDAARKNSRDKTANKQRRAVRQLRPGSVVMLRDRKPLEEGAKRKLAKKHFGLFVVTRLITDVTVELRRVAASAERLRLFHIDNLEPVRQQANKFLVLSAPFPPATKQTLEAHDEEETPADKTLSASDVYEIDSILGMRLRNGQLQFLVHWKGYSAEDDDWVDELDVEAPAKIESFVQHAGGNLRLQ
jgi:transposase InsO family protein